MPYPEGFVPAEGPQPASPSSSGGVATLPQKFNADPLGRPDNQSPEGQVSPGNINLSKRPVVHNQDGTISTVRSITITDDKGHAILIPTVVGDKVVSNADAVAHYKRTGENLGVFKDEPSANAYAQRLHNEQAQQYGGGRGPQQASPSPTQPLSGMPAVVQKLQEMQRANQTGAMLGFPEEGMLARMVAPLLRGARPVAQGGQAALGAGATRAALTGGREAQGYGGGPFAGEPPAGTTAIPGNLGRITTPPVIAAPGRSILSNKVEMTPQRQQGMQPAPFPPTPPWAGLQTPEMKALMMGKVPATGPLKIAQPSPTAERTMGDFPSLLQAVGGPNSAAGKALLAKVLGLGL